MTKMYVLDGKTPKRVNNIIEWGEWFETAKRHIAVDNIGDVTISTVFLGIDHAFLDDAAPVLFETLVFGGDHDGEMERYHTWEEAEAGHARMLKLVRGET